MLSFSPKKDLGIKKAKGTVLGNIDISLNYLVRLPDNRTKFTTFAMIDANVKGVPVSIVKRLSKDGAMLPMNLEKYMDKVMKKNK